MISYVTIGALDAAASVAFYDAVLGAAHAAALAFGGSDEGAPGPRPPESTTNYVAYMRDPTGNKLAVMWAEG